VKRGHAECISYLHFKQETRGGGTGVAAGLTYGGNHWGEPNVALVKYGRRWFVVAVNDPGLYRRK